MIMHIHKPGQDDPAGCIDNLPPIRPEVFADCANLVSGQQKVRPFDDPKLTRANERIHGEDERCVPNQGARLVGLAQLRLKVHNLLSRMHEDST